MSFSPPQTCVTVLADDDVVVDGNAERVAIWTIAFVIWISACGGRRIAGGMVVQPAAMPTSRLIWFLLVS
jgi:hypothetical protein